MKLALNGGKPVIDYAFKRYNNIGDEEIYAVTNVLKGGVLSDFLGNNSYKFYGGANVQALERAWEKTFNTRHAVSMNSATSALCAAIGACDIGPGDEVIVSPYTMSASATAILFYNAVPVFVDICEKTCNISHNEIIRKINNNTKAIMVPSIFGYPARLKEILKIARVHNLKVIEDAAQAPLAKIYDKNVGTFGDIGVYSLNRHKHIQAGEGGIAVTNNRLLYKKLMLIRNHGEIASDLRSDDNLINTFGFNFRMTEIEAAIAIEQLKKINFLVEKRIDTMNYLTKKLKKFNKYLEVPSIDMGFKHVYYLYPIKYIRENGMPHRDEIVNAIVAEGVQGLRPGFVKPLYRLKMYQQKVAYGISGCPFKCPLYDGKVSYDKKQFPITEKMHNHDLITFHVEHYDLNFDDIDKIADAFEKIFTNIDEIKCMM